MNPETCHHSPTHLHQRHNRVCLCVRVWMCMHMCARARVRVCVCTRLYVCANVCVRVCARACVCVCVCVCYAGSEAARLLTGQRGY